MKRFSFLVFIFLGLGAAYCPGALSSLAASEHSTRVLIIGDSISAGLGVEIEQAYPSVLQNLLEQKEIRKVIVNNASISGSTSASAVSRLRWFLRVKPDILLLALGANDGLRGLSTAEMSRNLNNAIILAEKNNIRIILAGMELPPNYGPEYTKRFRNVFSSLAEKHNLTFIPFLLKNVAGHASLNQADGIHPNPAGHKIIAATVLPYILELL